MHFCSPLNKILNTALVFLGPDHENKVEPCKTGIDEFKFNTVSVSYSRSPDFVHGVSLGSQFEANAITSFR